MRRGVILPMLFASAAAALFVSLGFWQLRRHNERAAWNRQVAAGLERAPAMLRPGWAPRAHERVTVTGVADYANEIVWTHRSRQGSPGVNLLTPVFIGGSDTAVLVNRGWVYSFDASAVASEDWREGDTLRVTGWVSAMPEGTDAAPSGRRIARVERRRIAPLLPYPVAPYVIVITSDGRTTGVPARLGLPALDSGPHLSYAIQWFSFAAIAIAGTGYWVYTRRRRNPDVS